MNEDKKDFNAMLNSKDNMPKITEIKDSKGIKKWGGRTLVIAPPIDYDKYMKQIPSGKLISTSDLRKKIAKDYNVEVCCPLTAGIFVNICAWASFQRSSDKTPYWRTLKSDGELNVKYPGGIETQKNKLESEGHEIIVKGKKNLKYYVKDYEKHLFTLDK